MIYKLTELLNLANKVQKKKVAVAVANDIHVLGAVDKAYKMGLIAPFFIGDKSKIIELGIQLNIDIEDRSIIDISNETEACAEAARMASTGEVDIIMKGLVPTNILLKQIVAKRYNLVNDNLLSHLAIFEVKTYPKLLGVTDAAMNIAPEMDDKEKIIKNAVKAFQALGIAKPKVALLTAVEKVNQKMPATVEAAALKGKFDSLKTNEFYIDGPLALDNAISAEAAHHKNISGPVAGDADILVVPDIEAGNILYKALTFLANAKCAAIIMGGKVPIVLTSRADSEENKFYSIVLGVLTSK